MPTQKSGKNAVERNVRRFDEDVRQNRGYAYTTNAKLSSEFSNRRISQAVHSLTSFENKSVIDIGCGDGMYTQEFIALRPKSIFGIDASAEAIECARSRCQEYSNVKFEVQDVCQIVDKTEKFDIAVVRGLLHHLYDPKNALDSICRIAREVIVVEPNGYNPILKIIEKKSAYHIQHEEKSYPPIKLDRWFQERGGEVVAGFYVGLVPFFCPDPMAKLLKWIEPFVEHTPLIRMFFCGQYIQYIRLA